MVGAASVLLGILLAIGFGAAGWAKVTEHPTMMRTARRLGFKANRQGQYRGYIAIGIAELFGAAGVLAGLWGSVIWVGRLAGFGLLVLMFLAVRRHMRFDGGASAHVPPLTNRQLRDEWMPAAAMGGLSLLYVLARIAS